MSGSFGNDFKRYSETAWKMLKDITLAQTPFFKPDAEISRFNQFVLINLFTSLYSTSESIFMLIVEMDIWEAEVILRTVFEGTIKYLYLMSDKLDEDSKLINEYYIVLPEIQKIIEHKKATEALEFIRLYSSHKHPLETSILSKDELEFLEEKYPLKIRKTFEQRWGFGSILKILIEKDDKFKNLTSLYYAYSLSSHFIHYDGTYIKMRNDSINNAVNENTDLDFGHAIRIISNTLVPGQVK